MANLTKEYFDRKIGGATKDPKSCINNKYKKLTRLINTGFEDVIKRLDVRERVEKLEKKVGRIMEAINLRA